MRSATIFLSLVAGCAPPSSLFDDSFLRVEKADASIARPFDAGSDAGSEPPIRLRDLAITALIYDQLTLLDGGSRVFGLSRPSQAGATWRQRDGGWATRTSEELADGGYVIRDVPEGDVLVFFSGAPTTLTSANHIDFSRFVQGRSDAQPAPRGTPTRLQFDTTIDPFTPGDTFIIFSQETPFSFPATIRYQAQATSGSFTPDWSTLPFGMPNGSAGDRLGLLQLRPQTNGALSWKSAIAGATVAAPDLMGGIMSSTNLSLRTTPIAGLTLDLDAPGLEATAVQSRPTLSGFRGVLEIIATRGNQTLGFSEFGWLQNPASIAVFRMEVIPSGVARTTLTPSWIDLFPRSELTLRYTAAFGAALSHPLGNGQMDLFNVRRLPLPAVNAVLSSTLGPARAPALNGMPATTARSGVGLSPVLTWLPPERGTASHYQLTLTELSNGSFQNVETWRVKSPLFVIPSALLRRGSVYSVIIDSVASTEDFERPNLQPAEIEIASTCTDPFSP